MQAVLLFLLIAAAQGAVISNVSPNSGSTMGGTVITIFGSGFERGGVDGQTNVYIGNQVCQTILYYSTDFMRVCITPPQVGSVSAVSVKVVLISVQFTEFAMPALNYNPVFNYVSWRTPFVSQILGRAVGAGDLTTFRGYFRSSTITDYDIRINGTAICDLGSGEDGMNPNLINAARCLASEQEAGYFNVTFNVAANGYPTYADDSYEVDPTGSIIYTHQVLPKVTKISSTQGSIMGGGIVTITGTGFSWNTDNSTRVLLEGAPCIVLTSSSKQITCTPGPFSGRPVNISMLSNSSTTPANGSFPYFIGGRGLTTRVWLNSNWNERFKLLVPRPADMQFIQTTETIGMTSTNNDDNYNLKPVNYDNYHQELEGYFLPPYTADYSFYVSCDDYGSVFLSSNESPANLKLYAECPTYLTTYWKVKSQIGPLVRLVAGNKYFFRIGHQEGGGGDWVRVAVRIYNLTQPLTPAQTYYQTPTESQIVSISTAVTREVQTITVSGVSGGSFRLNSQSSMSSPLNWDASSSDVAAAVASINQGCTDINGARVSVYSKIRNTTIIGYTWSVTFNCPTMSGWPVLGLINQNLAVASGESLTLTTRRAVQASLPVSGSFRLILNDTYTNPIAYNADTSTIQNSILSSLPTVTNVAITTSNYAMDGLSIRIQFLAPRMDFLTLGIDAGNSSSNFQMLTGQNLTVSVTTEENGSNKDLFLDPIPADYFAEAFGRPSVEVWSNNIKASTSCISSTGERECTFLHSAAATPEITQILPNISSGFVPGNNLTIYGSQLGGVNASVSVKVGPADCIIADAAPDGSTIVCTLKASPPGLLNVTVTVANLGSSRCANGSVCALNVLTTVNSVTPTIGSVLGGQLITVTGTGLNTDTGAITVGGLPCLVNSIVAWSKIVCSSPSWASINSSVVSQTSTTTTTTIATTVTTAAPTTSSATSTTETSSTHSSTTSTTMPTTTTSAETSTTSTTHSSTTSTETSSTTTASTASSSSETTTAPTSTTSPVTTTTGHISTTPAPTTTVPTTSAPFIGNIVLDGSLVGSFSYSEQHTPNVTAVSPSQVSSGISTLVSISAVSLLGNFSDVSGYVVSVSNRNCKVQNVSATILYCTLERAAPISPASAQSTSQLSVWVSGFGYARLPAQSSTIDLALRVTQVSPSTGSLAGGTTLSIIGAGFPSLLSQSSVTLDLNGTAADGTTSATCTVISSAWNLITCTTAAAPSGKWFASASNGTFVTYSQATTLAVSVNGIKAVCASATSCAFAYSNLATPTVTALTSTGYGGTVLTISGTGLASGTANVSIANSPCPVIFANDTQLFCTVPSLTAGSRSVSVMIAGLGFASNTTASVPLLFLHSLIINNISPQIGSTAGGTRVTVFGQGLSLSTSILFAASTIRAAPVSVSADFTTLVVLTPPTTGSTFPVNRTISASVVGATDVLDRCGGMVAASRPSLSVTFLNCTSPDVCTFTYNNSLAYTPLLSAAPSPASGFQGTSIVLRGTGFGNYSALSFVTIGGVVCNPPNSTLDAWQDTRIICNLGGSPAGDHVIAVTIEGKGYARHSISTSTGIRFKSLLEVTSVTPSTGGYAGGSVVTVTGRGFSPASIGTTTAWFFNSNCTVISASYDTLTCRTSPLVTLLSAASLSVAQDTVLTGIYFGVGGSASTWALAFDGDVETTATLSSPSCNLGIQMPAGSVASLRRIRFFPRLRYSGLMQNGRFEASADNGASWLLVRSLSDRVQESWNEIMITDADLPFRNNITHLRYVGPASSNCAVNEIQFIGLALANGPVSSLSADGNFTSSCNIAVATTVNTTLPTGTVISVGAIFNATASGLVPPIFLYDSSITPVVLGISPNNGTARGGTLVTITGRGLSGWNNDFNTSLISIVLHGFPCTVTSATANTVLCVTSPRREIRDSSPSYSLSPIGAATFASSDVKFRYIDRWSEVTTWLNNEPPIEGDTVVVPAGQSVLLDISPPKLRVIAILGEMVFDNRDLNLSASYILVHGGRFLIGTESQPYVNKAIITLHADRYNDVEVPRAGAKNIAVYNRPSTPSCSAVNTHPHDMGDMMDDNGVRVRGQLDIHGIPRRRVWTKVDATALAGSYSVVCSEQVDFAPGERVVITSSSRNPEEAEEMIVVSLGADNVTVTFTRPLQHTHVSGVYNIEGRRVDMRFEIGLLSRNIIIQGDENSERQMYGVHTIALGGAAYRVENAEIRHCGQAGVLGRYCTHAHMAMKLEDGYVRSNSIHHTFQRATTVHSTFLFTVKNNFAYHVHGHTFFVEDGNEVNNVFESNLAAVTLPLAIMLKSDLQPASFWMASPQNIWRHNVAAGSSAHGYWFELDSNPGGPSFTTTICPNRAPLVEFYNNTAHSNSAHGLRIYPFWSPHTIPCDGSSPTDPMYFHNLTSFSNGGNGIFNKRVGDMHYISPTLVNNAGYELYIIKYEDVKYSENPNVVDMLAVSTLDYKNPGRKQTGAVFTPQNEYFYVDGITMVNYGESGAISGCCECTQENTLRQGGYTVRFQRLKFVNTTRRIEWTPPYKDIFIDKDGTLSGMGPNSTVTQFRAWNNVTGCAATSGSFLDSGIVCNAMSPIRRLQIDGVNPSELDDKYAVLSTYRLADGSVPPYSKNLTLSGTSAKGLMGFLPKETYGWVMPVVANSDIFFGFQSLIDFQTMRVRWSEPDYVPAGSSEWARLNFRNINYRHNYQVIYAGQNRPWLDSGVPLPSHDFGTGAMWDNKPGSSAGWSVIISTLNTTRTPPMQEAQSPTFSMSIAALQCPLSGCPLPPPAVVGNITRWSDPATWGARGIPALGEDVVINSTMNVLLDISPPALGQVVVQGRLEFEDSGNYVFEASTITVFGSLQVGTPSKPYTHNTTIRLDGNVNSMVAIVDNSLFLGNKVLAVVGSIQMVGVQRAVPWTKLAVTAANGTTSLTLRDAVDWVVGDKLTITPTEFDGYMQVEEVFVKSISQGGRVIGIDRPLAYQHFAGNVTYGANGQSVFLAAAVGVVSRNIAIEGNTDGGVGYGGHVVVAQLPGVTSINASATFINVEMRRLGKTSTEHASIQLRFAPTRPANVVIQGCGFSDNFNYGIYGVGAVGLVIQNNVMTKTYRSAINLDQDCLNANITGNLVSATLRSPDETNTWVVPIAALYLQAVPAQLSDNVATGSADAAFVFAAPSCAKSDSIVFNNEAAASLIGVWLLASPSMACVRASTFVSWKNSHIGLMTLDQNANVEIDRVILSDNHIGITLNYVTTDVGGYSRITNTVVMGSSPASNSCSASVDCRAMTKTDIPGLTCGSVFGPTWRRVGVIASQYLNRAKTCIIDGSLTVCRPPTRPERLCGLPWEKRFGLPSTKFATMQFENVTFAFFNETDCGRRSVAVSLNPSQPEYAPPMLFRGVTWFNTSTNAMFSFGKTAQTATECESGCDAINMFFASDLDGSLAGILKGSILSDNPSLALPSPSCYPGPLPWGANVCPGLRLIPSVFENLDLDRMTRRIGPVKITKLDNGIDKENRTLWSLGPFNDECAHRFFFGQYPYALQPGRNYDIILSGSMPKKARMWFVTDDPADAVKVSVFYTDPNSVDIYVGSRLVEASTTIPTLPSAAQGANVFDPQGRRLHLVLRGGGQGSQTTPYLLQSTVMIQLTMTMAVTIDQFNGPKFISNLATLLSIPASTIKIVSVQAGSVIANVAIVDSANSTTSDPTNTTATDQSVRRLQALSTRIVTLAQNGGLDVGYAVSSLSVVPPTLSVSDNSTSQISAGPIAVVPVNTTTFVTTTAPTTTSGPTTTPTTTTTTTLLPPATSLPATSAPPRATGTAAAVAPPTDDSGSGWEGWKTALIVIAGVILGALIALVSTLIYRRNKRPQLLDIGTHPDPSRDINSSQKPQKLSSPTPPVVMRQSPTPAPPVESYEPIQPIIPATPTERLRQFQEDSLAESLAMHHQTQPRRPPPLSAGSHLAPIPTGELMTPTVGGLIQNGNPVGQPNVHALPSYIPTPSGSGPVIIPSQTLTPSSRIWTG